MIMIPVLIGIASGLLVILLVAVLRLMDKAIVYGLILSGIGFLYVGYTWSDTGALLINAAQAVVFVLLAYYGIIRGLHILAIGYFLHGSWDLVYNFFANSQLIPPHYDLFCLSIDFTIGFYLLKFRYQKSKSTLPHQRLPLAS
jgi:uncharacterized protein DUF6010